MIVSIYIYDNDGIAQRLDLFDDERISITSTVQNYLDIGKLFTDFSQSFTVPANTNNNKILQHWYENSLQDGFDHRIKHYGYIEIDTIRFKFGKFILDKCNEKDGQTYSYSLTFIGNLTQLKDRFKDDKLKDLKDPTTQDSLYLPFNHTYSLTEVKNRIQSDTYDLAYPLCGSIRKFYYNQGSPSQDISNTSGAIKFNELFPALRVSKILEAIQTAYGIEFDSVFFNSLTFTQMYLLLKNAESFAIKSQPVKINFTSKSSAVFFTDGSWTDFTSSSFPQMNLTSDTMSLGTAYYPPVSPPWATSLGFPASIVFKSRTLKLKITTASTDLYKVDVYNNGILYTSFQNLSGTQTLFVFPQSPFGVSGMDNNTYNFTYYLSSENSITFTSELSYIVEIRNTIGAIGFAVDGYYRQVQTQTATGASQTTQSIINVSDFVPDIKVIDFMSSLIKMFNLIITPITETKFKVETLERYYEQGRIIDITEYSTTDSIDITPPSLFKKINFKHQRSENILNNAYRGYFNLEYGDLGYENKDAFYNNEYEIETIFEDVLWERTTGEDFITASFLDKDQQPYTPKPVLMYSNGMQSVSLDIHLKDSVTNTTVSQYRRFSNEIYLTGSDPSYVQTLNFGAEISPWYLVTQNTGLYEKFYSGYIENLYNIKTRVLTLQTLFPSSVLQDLKLSDRLIYKNKRYVINSMSPELTTGETKLELITDSRDLQEVQSVMRVANFNSLVLDNTAQEIEAQIYLNNMYLWRSKVATGFLLGSYPLTGNKYKDDLLTISVPANLSGVTRYDFILIEYLDAQFNSTVEKILIQQNA